MIKMFKTIINAILYIIVIAAIFCFFTWLVQDLVAYQLDPTLDIPLAIKIVGVILSVPIVGNLISFILSRL